jgi:energy-coupling factor transporter transmembrane protein EcfT
MMEETFKKVEELAEHVKEYVNNRISSMKLSTAEKSSGLLANIIARVIVVLVFVFFVAFVSIALAFFLAKKTGELYWGFLMVAGFYLLLALLVWALKERILRMPIMNAMLEQFFKNEEDEKD